MQKNKNGLVVLTEGAPWKCILRFAVPMLLGSLLQQLYYTVDAMMVGRIVGQQALSGVGTCGVLTNLLVAFSTGFSAGAAIILARYYGAGDSGRITQNARATIISLLCLGAAICGVGLLFGRPLLRYGVSVPESLIGYSAQYFRIYAVGFIFQFVYNGAAALLRSIGDSRASLYFLFISMLLNILLDYTFMQKLDLGVAGAAWAAVLSQLMACGVSLVYMFRRYDLLRFYGKGITTGREDVALIVKTGFPMALQSMIGTVFNLMVQRLVNSFGEAMIASYTVVSRVEGYMHLPTSTLYQAIPTYTAQNLGAEKPQRIRAGLRHTVIMAVIFTLAVSIAVFALAPEIASSFGISGLSAQYCISHVRCLAFPILLFAVYFPCTGLYQGMGKGMVSTALSTGFLACCLMFAYLLRYIPAIGYRSLFICKPLAWVIITTVNYIYYFSGKWEKPQAE